MARVPETTSDDTINMLWEGGPAIPTEATEQQSRDAVSKSLDGWHAALNPELIFSQTDRLFGDTKRLEYDAAVLKRVEEVMHKPPAPTNVAELFFSTNRRRSMVFDPIPVGHDTGYRCYDGVKHSADSAFDSGEYGDGLTEDEAYAQWIKYIDEPKPRAGMIVNSSPTDPPEFISHKPVWREGDDD